MRAIVHMPRTPEKEKKLRQKVSSVYAQAVSCKIAGLTCPKAQKIKLFAQIKMHIC